MSKKNDTSIPSHVALIPDGNRRWARRNGLRLLLGYSRGVKKFQDFMKWSKDMGVSTVTVWALSTENLRNRTGIELKVLFDLYTKTARDKKLLASLMAEKARFKVIGDLAALPKRLQDALAEVERQTRANKDITINMLINYGGREDLVHALTRIERKGKVRVTEQMVRENLRTADIPDVDLIVRTSGEMRLSGLLPWQSAYSELYFADKYWPEFEKKDFAKAIATYSKRQRRFGK